MPAPILPFRSKLVLIFAGVCVTTFGIGGLFVSSSAKSALEDEIRARLDFQSSAYAAALDGYLHMLQRRSEDFASDGFIRDRAQVLVHAGGDPVELRAELRTHLLENKLPLTPAFTDLTLIAPDGRVLLAAHDPPEPRVAAAVLAPRADGTAWFSGWLGPKPGGTAPRLAISTPIWSRDRGERLGELVAWVHPSIWIVDALRANRVGASSAPGQVELQLIDSQGRKLRVRDELTQSDGPRPDSELVLSGFGIELDPPADGVPDPDTYRQDHPIASNGWSVQVELSGVSVQAAVSGLQSRFLGFGIVISLAAAVLFLLPMRFLTRPLLDLAAAARRLAGGDATARVIVGSSDEIGEVGQAFNSMAEAIEERTRLLECTADDLRARKNELGHERDRLRAVLSSMRDGLVVLDPDGTPIVHNGAAGPLLKQLRSEGAKINAHHLCETAQETLTACQTCLFSPEVGARSCVVEIDGGVFEIHAARLAPDATGRAGRVLVSRDITDRVAQDEHQIHQERLAVLGEVAAVMAHELNNPLAAISMYNQMLGASLADHSALADQPELIESVEVIQRNVTSCKQAIRELLDYATASTPEVNVVDVHATLHDVNAFLRPVLERSTVELRFELEEEPLEVTGDEVQVRQIFTNLIVNAVQATQTAAENGNGAEHQRRVTVSAARDGGHAVVRVSDNGGGIAPEVREKIFRPFYSTKGRGSGTGLGLPTARRIAELHGGGLDLIESDAGGSVFRVRLRLHQEVGS